MGRPHRGKAQTVRVAGMGLARRALHVTPSPPVQRSVDRKPQRRGPRYFRTGPVAGPLANERLDFCYV
jgi:hypothetical protein